MTARNTFVIKLLLLACLIHSARAQQTVWFDTNQHYKLGIELLDKQKYVAAAEQFSCVQKSTDKTSIILDRQHLSLLQENAQYYQAYCALKLGNQNAESPIFRISPL